ncbi:hypothetical protein LTR37_019399 [Vermiconidia calcicola]|uniref:Uncharacterized protein n=1 Tax=Vermiconidia calcicola TaxID=1690605 RepID=A0ACC3MG14_9PEZI|nr:hypothetical protein LTR37_019399 [Vermiconidia calcicola]
MLTAPLLRRRIPLQASASSARLYSDGREGGHGASAHRDRRASQQKVKSYGGEGSKQDPGEGPKEPSLFEQLFPDQEAERRKREARELPRIPLPSVEPVGRDSPTRTRARDVERTPRAPGALRRRMEWQDGQETKTSVLVLRNASKNLTEEDFRRLVPQGQHMEGWRLEQGDFLKVIPGRDWRTLEQQNYYYLLFSSALSAFTYQGHAMRVQRLVAQHTPSTMLSPMLPPSGYMIRGMDANEAIASYTILPPDQSLDLRQLKPPLSPLMESIVRNNGYASLLGRKNRMPYEVRLTLDGPQLHRSHVKHIFLLSGKDRGLSWSGGSDAIPPVSEWEPSSQFQAPSPMSNKREAQEWSRPADRIEAGKAGWDEKRYPDKMRQVDEDWPSERDHSDEQKRRTRQKTYLVGFHTEYAMQSFAHFWHRRPMTWEGMRKELHVDDDEGDMAPIAHVEVLW